MKSIICYPNINFKLTKIKQPYKLVSSPLIKLLIKRKNIRKRMEIIGDLNMKDNYFKFGFITFD